MPQPNDLSRSLTALDENSTLIAVIEMSQTSWLVAGIVPGVERHPLKKLAPDVEALLRLLERWRDEAATDGRTITRIAVAYEAGRDGFWLARWLRAHGIEADVIHPNSIAVSREHCRTKTDRLDTALLQRAFSASCVANASMATIPSLEEEDAKRPGRERENLVVSAPASATGSRAHLRGSAPRLQADPAASAGAARATAHAGGRTGAAQHPGRAAARDGTLAPARRTDPGDRDRAPAAAGTGTK